MSSTSQQTHRKIVIVGGTGKQGSAVINSLLKSSSSSVIDIITLTRNTQSKKAQELKEHGVELVQIDIDEVTVEELATIFAGK
jgi:saccharopine dehydrogenase-like NADP-dependent oxidoreductase